jgi:type VI secretion system protein ImpK
MDQIDEITRDCFNAIIQLRRIDPGSSPDPNLLHRRLCNFIDGMINKARQMRIAEADMADAAYAVVALADEVALAMPGAVASFWMYNLLQLRYFNENLAGENFFRRAEQLRADPRRYAVLRVYYLCLLFGFQGRYRISGGENERMAFVESLQQDLVRTKMMQDEILAPRGNRPAMASSRVRRNLPILWLSGAAIGCALLINLVLHISLSSGVRDVVDRIGALTAHATAR